MSILYDNIELLRNERGLTLQGLSDVIGISKSTISEWNKDDASPRVNNLEVIANYFDVSIDFLVGRTQNRLSHKEDLCSSSVEILKMSEALQLDEKATFVVIELMQSLSKTYQ